MKCTKCGKPMAAVTVKGCCGRSNQKKYKCTNPNCNSGLVVKKYRRIKRSNKK